MKFYPSVLCILFTCGFGASVNAETFFQSKKILCKLNDKAAFQKIEFDAAGAPTYTEQLAAAGGAEIPFDCATASNRDAERSWRCEEAGGEAVRIVHVEGSTLWVDGDAGGPISEPLPYAAGQRLDFQESLVASIDDTAGEVRCTLW